ncbi:MAG: von Willebrand factor type A domain-containing protein [Candidatus Moduliflexus flocculans]|nr:von Willebrand factor type A domain-containing protein [Candidatus Moduliflexus flocculans]
MPAQSGAPSASQNWGAPPAKREPYDTFFEDYGVNPSIDTEDDNLSTFALDVDTGSYTIMRNYLKDGYEVPPGLRPRGGIRQLLRSGLRESARASGLQHFRGRRAFALHADRALPDAARRHPGLPGPRLRTQGCQPGLRDRRLRLDGHGQPPRTGEALA